MRVEEQYDCYWDARTSADFYALIGVQILTTLILGFLVVRLVGMARAYRAGSNIRMSTLLLIHGMVLLWSLGKSRGSQPTQWLTATRSWSTRQSWRER